MKHVLVVDRKGLANKLKHKPKAFVVYELVQNAWDEEGVTYVNVTIEMQPGRPVCRIVVEDDAPDGFQDMASIYTMFRDSKKAPDPTKRGRFELGEKLVIAIAQRVEVITTKGGVLIENDERKATRQKRERGSTITVDIKMTRDEHTEMMRQVRMLIGPGGIRTTINGEPLPTRIPVAVFSETLQTIHVDDEGALKPTARRTSVSLYEVAPGEVAHIYEMGIPIVKTGDKYHYNVQQRVPMNWERNNIPGSYLKTLRVFALNATQDLIDHNTAANPWVTEALTDERCSPEATTAVIKHRFGPKRVINDLSDPEGTKIAVSKGYTVIPGGALPKAAWDNVRKAGAALPAGQVTPSPKPYSPDGHPEKVIPPEKWTADMQRRANFAQQLFQELGYGCLQVDIVQEPTVWWSANFGDTRLCLNYGRLGKVWFARPNRDVEVLDLLIHEFCHFTVKDHLSEEMHETATRIGARLTNLALEQPELFR